MKKTILLSIIVFFHFSLKAQKDGDTIKFLADTINIHGKVIDEKDMPVASALIITNTYDEHSNPKTIRTDKNGEFKLFGINPIERILFSSDKGINQINNNGSRFLLVKLFKPSALEINLNATSFSITAKRITKKPKVEIKQVSGKYTFGPNYDYLSNYKGGIEKIKELIKKNVTYPSQAIDKNIEGMVAIQFIVTKKGSLENFIILKDIGFGCADQIINTIKKGEKWTPSIRNGSPIDTSIIISVPFSLID